MSEFECKLGDFLVRARYYMIEGKLVWNAVLYRSGTPVHSMAGSVLQDPKTSAIDLIENAIAAAVEAQASSP